MAAPRHALRRQGRAFGLRASETMSSFEDMSMYHFQEVTWRQKYNAKASGGRWRATGDAVSWSLPRGVEGRGMEFKKYFGEVQSLRPQFMGGPMEAVHDVHRNKHFWTEWEFGDRKSLSKAQFPEAHIRTQRHRHHYVPQFSKPMLENLSENIFDLTERKRIWNPYTPHQPVQGPAKVTHSMAETVRKQAFMAGIQFPEFPDVVPQKQRDPWDEEEETAIPLVSNDKLLDAEVWEKVNENMVGMEKKVKAFKDTERKKLWTWKMTNLMQQLKRARQEETFIAAQNVKLRQKQMMEEREAQKREWMRKTQGGKFSGGSEADEFNFDEETEMETVTKEDRKEAARNKLRASRFQPPGSKL
eukprot:TRINITY_DN20781_c0_g1_i1.p1 TRINITY_DN20781_c0_g1~~TRINITY_DN20781_c0_g1_i1.p1  ORF type:complete len:358 (+),score=156.80 TRINITY_DN20781_c0_g1_i1:94-1167(+)